MAGVNPFLVGLAMLSLISLGLAINLATACFPLLLWALQPPAQQWYYSVPVLLVQCTHLWLLWTDKAHLAAYRFLTLPLRRALFPIVMFVAKMDAIKEKENVAFVTLDETIGPGKEGFLQYVRSNTRRSYKKTLKSFASQGIRHESVQCETSLHLQSVCPVIWEHQKRQCQSDGKNLVEEFIKRFLVVSVVPDVSLDLFFNPDGTLVAVSVDVLTGPVYQAFLYFARDGARRSGIWFYANLLSLVRARSFPGVERVNAMTHHMESKRNAGFDVAHYEDDNLMDALFPWEPTTRMPEEALHISLLDDTKGGRNGTVNASSNAHE